MHLKMSRVYRDARHFMCYFSDKAFREKNKTHFGVTAPPFWNTMPTDLCLTALTEILLLTY